MILEVLNIMGTINLTTINIILIRWRKTKRSANYLKLIIYWKKN